MLEVEGTCFHQQANYFRQWPLIKVSSQDQEGITTKNAGKDQEGFTT